MYVSPVARVAITCRMAEPAAVDVAGRRACGEGAGVVLSGRSVRSPLVKSVTRGPSRGRRPPRALDGLIQRSAPGAALWLGALLVIWLIYYGPVHTVSPTTAVTGLLGLGIIALAAARPDRSLIALIVLLPFQSLLLAKLFALGMPTSIVRHLAAWKEALALGVVIAGIRGFIGDGHRADALDRVALSFVALVALYLLAQPKIVPGSPAGLSTRVLAFRQDAGFVLVLLGARHARMPPGFLGRAGRAAIAVAAVAAGVCVFEAVDSGGWNHFVVQTIGYTRYQLGVLHAVPVNARDIRVYGVIGSTKFVRTGSVFLSALTAGFYLVIGFGLAFERVTRPARTWRSTLVAMLIGTGILLTQTRSAILAGLVVVAVAFAPAAGRGRHWRTQLALVVAALALIAVPAVVSSGVGRRVRSTTASNSDNQGHVSGLFAGLDTIRAHPLGLGLGTSAGVGQRTSAGGSQAVIAENGYLQVGIELGVLGLIIFAALTATLLAALRSAARRSPHAVIAGSWGALAGLAVATWFLQTWVDFGVAWTAWGLAGTAIGLAPGRERPA